MAEILVEGWWFFERRFMPVDTPVQVALFHQLSEQFHMRPLSGTNDRRPNGDAVRLHSPENVIHDFLYGSSGDLFSAGWTVRFSNSRPKKAEIVLDLRHGCHGGARIGLPCFWSMEMAGESPSMESQSAFFICPMNWRAYETSSQRTAAGLLRRGYQRQDSICLTRYARNDNKLTFWKVDRDVFEVVGSRFDLNPALLT